MTPTPEEIKGVKEWLTVTCDTAIAEDLTPLNKPTFRCIECGFVYNIEMMLVNSRGKNTYTCRNCYEDDS